MLKVDQESEISVGDWTSVGARCCLHPRWF